MSKQKVRFTHPRQRSVLTDMLPFEVPPTFSNKGFYQFIRRYGVEFIDNKHIYWVKDDDSIDKAIKFIFGIKQDAEVKTKKVIEWGKEKTIRSLELSDPKLLDTIPFNFVVTHKTNGRVLSVIHPRNQINIANFYADYSSLIIYYASKSDFSIRKPVSLSKYTYFDDDLHALILDDGEGIEVDGKEYEQLGSYFVYKKYRNIHRFFESYKYHRCEKKYDAMVQIDVTKCFDSIYTHSMSWAIFGKDQAKHYLDDSKKTFAGKFDNVISRANHGETNGIVIGPEFSRVFSELILQSVDIDISNQLQKALNLTHKIDYEAFRYVDDFFIFYNKNVTKEQLVEVIEQCLKKMKLSINAAKIKPYEKPIITEITIAKDKISKLLNASIQPSLNEEELEVGEGHIELKKYFKCHIDANSLIVQFKAAVKESRVEYGDLLNYTFAIIENKLKAIINKFSKSDSTNGDRFIFVNSLIGLLEFCFFSYAASPKVNHTIRVSRFISTLTRFLNENKFSYDHKHLVFKYVHDNILQILNKNVIHFVREVESMYLLIVLSQLGKEYWLPETTLAKHFSIEFDEKKSEYYRDSVLSYFSITVILSYIKNKTRYDKLRNFIEKHSLIKLELQKANSNISSESIMLFLDLLVCPYIQNETKYKIAGFFDLTEADALAIKDSNDYWFSAWGDRFDLAKELDMKRSREVY